MAAIELDIYRRDSMLRRRCNNNDTTQFAKHVCAHTVQGRQNIVGKTRGDHRCKVHNAVGRPLHVWHGMISPRNLVQAVSKQLHLRVSLPPLPSAARPAVCAVVLAQCPRQCRCDSVRWEDDEPNASAADDAAAANDAANDDAAAMASRVFRLLRCTCPCSDAIIHAYELAIRMGGGNAPAAGSDKAKAAPASWRRVFFGWF